jgi:hypothetical protein
MTKPVVNAGTSPWIGVLWCALGLAPLLIGIVCFLIAALHLNLWLYADRYVAGELEVTRFDPTPGQENQGRTIEGVIHPGGERAFTSDRDIAIGRFVDAKDTTGRRVPQPSEIEGRRIDVWYWPKHAEVAQWWHPPTVVMPGTTQPGGKVVLHLVLGVAFVALGFVVMRLGWRHLKATAIVGPLQPPTGGAEM